MLHAYSCDPAFQKQIRRLHPGAVAVVGDWHQLKQRIPAASCLIAHVQPLDSVLVGNLAQLKAAFPHLPLVAVIERVPEAAAILRGIVVEELLWSEQLQQLDSAIIMARSKGFLQRVAAAIRANRQLTDITRQFIIRALASARPIRTVKRAAHALDVDIKTVHNHWAASGVRSQLTPKDFLDWIVLVRVAVLRDAAYTWSDVTSTTRVDQRAFYRIVERLLAESWADLDGAGYAVAEFRRHVLPAIAPEQFHELAGFSAFCHFNL